jgi:hypothetical protein
MKVIQNEDLINLFQFSCVDEMTPEKITSIGLRVVPTLFIRNQQHSQMYESKDALNWIKNFIINRREHYMQMAENHRKLIMVNNIKNRMIDGLNSYKQMESEGISDQYAYYSEKDLTTDIDLAQPKSFLPVGRDDEYGIITLQSDNDNKKMKEQEQKQKINQLLASRKVDENNIKSNMERGQIEAVIDATMGIK